MVTTRFTNDLNITAFRFESGTYGWTSGTTQWIGMVQSHEPDDNTNIIPIRYQAGTSRDVDLFTDGNKEVTGTINYFATDWRMLGFALGSVTEGGSPSPYTHLITAQDNNQANYMFSGGVFVTLPSFTIDALQAGVSGTGNQSTRRYIGAVVNTFTINMAQGEPVSVDLDYIAQASTWGSGIGSVIWNTSGLPGEYQRPFMFSDVRLQLPGGTIIQGMKNATLSINNNLQTAFYLNGSRVGMAPIPGNRDYELNWTMDANSDWAGSLYDIYYLGGSTFNMMLDMYALTQFTGGSRDITFVMSGCRISDMSMPMGTEGVGEFEVTVIPRTLIGSINDNLVSYNYSGAV